MPRFSFTQPICQKCWDTRYPDAPVKLTIEHGEQESCCYCGHGTLSGIYIRVDPAKVSYPTLKKD